MHESAGAAPAMWAKMISASGFMFGGSIVKLAIVVVYYVGADESDGNLITLHQSFIQKYTPKELYQVYASANRLPSHLYATLKAFPNTQVCEIPSTCEQGSREHAYYLDALIQTAFQDGATHVCTLDVDSFPIREGWVDYLRSKLNGHKSLVAILREENNDTELPHPSCIFFDRDFYDRYSPRFYFDIRTPPWVQSKAFGRLMWKSGQLPDTGIGIAFTLFQHQLKWARLKRSNQVNDHFLMGGIYDDVIFHLSSASWQGKLFRGDENRYRLLRVRHWLKSYVVRFRYGKRTVRLFMKLIINMVTRLSDVNQRTYRMIRDRLLADPDGYLLYLRHGNISSIDSLRSE